ncbi:MAG: tetratricopeptide repeat protein, partial [Bryobacterales bacterium]
MLGIGDVHAGADNTVSALEYYERALAQIQRAGAPESVTIAVEIKIADCLRRRGRHGEARTRLHAMLPRAEATGDEVLAARVRSRIGQVHNTLSDYETAREYGLEAYRVLRTTDAHEEVGNLEVTLGSMFHLLGDVAQAREYYENALATFRRIDDSEGIARTLNNLGVLLIKTPRWGEAREYFTRAIAVAEEAGNYARLAQICLNLGILCYTCGQWDLSAKHLTRALVISKETQPTLRVVRTNIALGILKLRRREFAAAGAHFHQILEIARRSGYRREEALALEFLGERELRQGDLAAADDYLQQALKICGESLAEGDVLFEVKTRLGEIALLRNESARAAELAQSALELARRFDDGVEAGRALRILGEAAAAEQRFADAESFFGQSIQTLVATPDVLSLGLARFAQAKFWVLRGAERAADGVQRDDEREAVATFEELVARFLELQLPDLAVRAIIELARARATFGALDEALAAISRGLALAETHSVPQVVHLLEGLRAEVEERCADESLTQWEEFRLL